MTPRRITYDFTGEGRGPEPGDKLVTSRSVYQVIGSRLVVRRELVEGTRRFSLVVIRLGTKPGDLDPPYEGQAHFPLRWYPRGSRKRSSNARQRRANV